MKKLTVMSIAWVLSLLTGFSYAEHCPDPETSSLKWGVIPKPWVENPFSPHHVQADVSTRFTRANIMVAGVGRGVVCTYKNSVGFYSIWWPVNVKIPARSDYNWIETLGGFVCTQSVNDCWFKTAIQ
ncbi:DUF3757 domain-containing protein [Legionella jamestowniensis]|uniref:DUF3757 domain-containing protein n=1 Tax=Legionella jamestowniensis TaxID=455 RepID=A0A0W0UFX2_9GAMM|nr:DUF3757 domain-containing protein [Legionella jamestowniensis]KTD06788.1 hypothetical protein Ljam_0983 [Legionella jamestowniensis]OCH97241.1 hypothetical protein A8135_03870 [Legionella jamestowniensis]SFL83267.1 Protein of unknown function [Legionella jamestowniensis DSM 19215]